MRALFFLGLLVLSVPVVQAQSAAVEALPSPSQSRVVDNDPLMDFRTRNVPQGRVDRDTGVLRAAYRLAPTVPLGATHEATARAYLDAQAERFGWATADDLLLVHEIDGHYSAHLTFQQTFGGIPVHNRFVKVSMGQGGHPSMVISGYAPHLREVGPVRLQPLMDASGAVLRAQQETHAQGISTPELVVYPSVPPRLAWRMTASPDGIPAAWEVLMDADTGEILYLRNQVVHMGTPSSASAGPAPLALASLPAPAEPVPAARAVVDGTGLVFDPDPLTSAGVPYGGAYVDNDDADVAVLNAQRKEVVLRDITLGTDGLYRLIGPYVKIIGEPLSVGRRTTTPPAEADPDAFRYGRANDSFEAVMAYYHIDKNQRYVQSLNVGYPIAEYPLPASPHGQATGGSFYLSENCLFFGDCGSPPEIYFSDLDIDSAEDADVILHGYAWALLDASVPGLFVTFEGISFLIGWAHYWAASYSRGLAKAGTVPTVQDWRTINNWHEASQILEGHGLRLDAPVEDMYPEDTGCDDPGPCSPTGDGLLWATTMMEIYDDLKKTVTDRLALASHAYLSSSSTFVDAAEALLQADENLYDGEHRSVLRERLVARGYLDVDDASLSVTLSVSPSTVAEGVGAAVVMVTATVDGGGTFADAETATVSVGTPGDSAEEGTDYEMVEDFTITIPADAPSATATFTLDLIDDDIAEGSETLGVMGSLDGRTVASAVLTITDGDVPSTALALTINPESVGEDDGTVSIEITASLDAGASTRAIPVMINVTDGTADFDDDYRLVSDPSSLVIPAENLSVMGTVRIEVLEDDLTEDNETVVIGATATGLRSASEEFTITDNDAASTALVLTISPESVRENAGTVSLEVAVSLNGAVRIEATPVTITVTNGTVLLDNDYRLISSSSSLVIPAEDLSSMGTVQIEVLEDDVAEGNKTVVIEVFAPGLTGARRELTITDNDAVSTALSLTIAPARLHEDSGTSWVRFGASMNGDARPSDTPVDVSVTGVTATADADYSAFVPISVMIPAGETSISDSLQIIITDDEEVEGNETVVIGVSAMGLIGTTQELVIIDDETAVRIDVLNVIAQDDGSYTVTAAVRQNMGAPVTSVVLYYGDGITFEVTPMQTLVMGSNSWELYTKVPMSG